jgi:mannose-6-phosphate isomerase-like protein (cupin superfamily)
MSRSVTLPRPLGTDHLVTLVHELAANPARWEARLQFCADERWWTLLHGDDVVDVWLLTWMRGTRTDLHDHGASAAAFTVVSGVLDEVRLQPGIDTPVTTRLQQGAVRVVEPGVLHDVHSPNRVPAVSIHAYSPPLHEMTYYERRAAGPQPIRTVLAHAEQAIA